MDCKLEELLKDIDAAANLMFSEKYSEAITCYNIVLRNNGNNVEKSVAAVSYNNRGFCYKNLDRFEDACDDLFEAIILYPDFPNPYAILGDIHREIGKNYDAQRDYYEALNLLNSIPEEKLHEGFVRAGIRAEKGLQLMGLEVTIKYQKIAENRKK